MGPRTRTNWPANETGRNGPKVLYVYYRRQMILSTGGVIFCLSNQTPPRDQPPWDQTHTSPPPWDQTPPPGVDTPLLPGTRHPPPNWSRLYSAYGQRAAGTHPNGMHSCAYVNLFALQRQLYVALYRPRSSSRSRWSSVWLDHKLNEKMAVNYEWPPNGVAQWNRFHCTFNTVLFSIASHCQCVPHLLS